MAAASRKRVAVVYDPRGDHESDRVGVEWMNWLARAGYHVEAIPLFTVATPVGLDAGVQTSGRLVSRRLLTQAAALRDLTEEHGIGVILARGTRANLVAIGAARRLPAAQRPLVVVSENQILSLRGSRPTLMERRHDVLARRWYRHADVALSATHPGAAELTAAFGVPASRSLVVPRAILAESGGRATPPERTEGRGTIRLIIPAGSQAVAHQHLAVLAAENLTRRGIPTEILAPAQGPAFARLRALARLRSVPLTAVDADEDWDEHVTDASVVFVPFDQEGFGRELIRAAALRVPSVAISSTLGVADAIVPGVTGELALDARPDSLADAVERAARLEIDEVDAWLERFSSDTSGRLLEQAVLYADSRRAG